MGTNKLYDYEHEPDFQPSFEQDGVPGAEIEVTPPNPRPTGPRKETNTESYAIGATTGDAFNSIAKAAYARRNQRIYDQMSQLDD